MCGRRRLLVDRVWHKTRIKGKERMHFLTNSELVGLLGERKTSLKTIRRRILYC